MYLERRRVEFYKWTPELPQTLTSKYIKALAGTGEFLAFGIDYEELQDGIGAYSTAIIELPDGSVKNVPVEMIMFIID